jgi:hypothetical protein
MYKSAYFDCHAIRIDPIGCTFIIISKYFRGKQDNNRGFYQSQDQQRGGGQYGQRSELMHQGSITSVYVSQPKQVKQLI